MIDKEKRFIGIIFGGNSNEHEISISSAKTVFKAFDSKLNRKRFIVKVFYINKRGVWFDNECSLKILFAENNQREVIQIQKLSHIKINFLENIDLNCIDVWFPLLHGINGEDGAIQGFLKFSQKPIVGSGIIGSALGMDKILMKKIFSSLEIPQVNYLSIQNQDLKDEKTKNKIINKINNKFNYPVFVKPSNSGSSLGISKVKKKSEILKALYSAWEIDSRIVVEEGLMVRELECGIIGKSKLLTSKIGEVSYKTDWYDYDSKYSIDNKVIIPAEINSDVSKQIEELAIKGCRALNIYGFARVDFFLEKHTNKIFLNEINTIPGFTSKSMFPMLWEASGLNIEQLVAKIVDITLGL